MNRRATSKVMVNQDHPSSTHHRWTSIHDRPDSDLGVLEVICLTLRSSKRGKLGKPRLFHGGFELGTSPISIVYLPAHHVRWHRRVDIYKIPLNHHFPMVFQWFSHGFSYVSWIHGSRNTWLHESFLARAPAANCSMQTQQVSSAERVT